MGTKQINRFLVTCVQEYSSLVDKPTYLVYKQMSKNGLIKLLEDDYMDLYGMSSVYLNDCIATLLGEKLQI